MVAPDVVAHPFRGLGLTNQPDGKRAAIFFFFAAVSGCLCFFFLLDAFKEPKGPNLIGLRTLHGILYH